MKKLMLILCLTAILCVPSCVSWIAKEETYQGSTLTIKSEGRSTSRASTTKSVKVVKGVDGRFYQVK